MPRWFDLVVAIGIVAAAVMGAVVTWRASVVSARAGNLAEQGMQELAQREQEIAAAEGQVLHDQRLVTRYQEHVAAWRLLEEQAEEVREDNPQLAERLAIEASHRLALSRSLLPYFRALLPGFDDSGTVYYDPEFALENLTVYSPTLRELNPDVTFTLSEITHEVVVDLVGVVALLVAALFFLTLSQLARSAVRPHLAVAGAVLLVIGAALFPMVAGSAP